MKTLMAVFLLLASTLALADKPECSYTPGGCVGNPPGLDKKPNVIVSTVQPFTAVPVPGTAALIGLGIAGLVVIRNRKK